MGKGKVAYDLSDAEEARIQAGIAADPDNPEITEAEWAARKPFAEVFPEWAANLEAKAPKKLISLRLDQDVIDGFRATGPGWQSRINAALRDKLAGR